ncbi:hypothetical protein JWG45_17905 [Leptospira sp. 201903070]|uniref:DUF5683 domain-containing protein n=1 Tax=Leptospira ainlahdjerensis TaxID=2810033 RepID=A0ABS2UF64_9LEPT|nr:hypothetical protein [Leptospira ainlahdjerensis]MBM9579025.1 hypothetical protein [Leptospira ainlahdjerensis]
MFATVFFIFIKIRNFLTAFLFLSLLHAAFLSEIHSDVLILKNGERIRADSVRMKNGNLVEFRIGKVTKHIEFSKVSSILPENPSSKKPKNKMIQTTVVTPAIVSEPAQQTIQQTEPEIKKDDVLKEKVRSPMSRTSKTLQALIPGWSPLLFSEDRNGWITGGVLALSELYVLYRGFDFFQKPKEFFGYSSDISKEALIPYYASIGSQNGFVILFFFFKSSDYFVTQRGYVMEKSEFFHQREFYGIALLSLIAVNIYLSSSELYSGDLKSVRLYTSDSGNTSSLSFTWVF